MTVIASTHPTKLPPDEVISYLAQENAALATKVSYLEKILSDHSQQGWAEYVGRVTTPMIVPPGAMVEGGARTHSQAEPEDVQEQSMPEAIASAIMRGSGPCARCGVNVGLFGVKGKYYCQPCQSVIMSNLVPICGTAHAFATASPIAKTPPPARGKLCINCGDAINSAYYFCPNCCAKNP